MVYDVTVIGAGIAGMTAAVYALRAGKSVLVIEKESIGGQITLSHRVENYPGYEAISGLDLAEKVMTQMLSLGAELEVDEVLSVALKDGLFEIACAMGTHTSKAVVLATGLRHRRLEAAEGFGGSGVSYCAVCDGAFYRGRDAAVVGGGNTAVSEAIYLADICRSVYLIHRRSGYRADRAELDKLEAKPNIIKLENYVIEGLEGGDALNALRLKNTLDGSEKTVEVSGLFVALGHVPQNEAFAGLLDLDENGFALADESLKTKTPGLFVAGDCRKKQVRQLTTAASDGAVAGLAASAYIDGL